MKIRIIIPIIIVTILVLPGALCAQEELRTQIHVGMWWTSPDGGISYSPVGPTQFVDLDDNLGLDTQWEPMFRVKTELPNLPNLYFKVTPLSFDDTGTSNQPFLFGDTVFLADEAIDSELTLNIYDLALFYRTPLVELGGRSAINAEVGLDARIITARAELTQVDFGEDPSSFEVLDVSARENVVFPMVYAGLDMQATEMLSLEAEIWGYAFRGEDLYSLIGRVSLDHFEPFLASIGYRAEIMDFDKDDLEIDANFMGPFIEVGFGF